MRKVNCIVLYKYENNHYKLLNITVKHKHENITLYNIKYDRIDEKHYYKYQLFNDLYKDILAFLKSNNFYVYKWNMFNNVWRDIDFIDIDNLSVDRYSMED